jgi:type IV secretion system protein VirB11
MRSDVAVRTHLRPLEPFFAQDDVTEISVNRPQEVWIARQGHAHMERHAVAELDLNRLETLAQLIAQYTDQEVTAEHPLLSAKTPDGFRIQVVRAPAVEPGLIGISIRKPSVLDVDLDWYEGRRAFEHVNTRPAEEELAEERILTPYRQRRFRDFIEEAIKARKNILISAGTDTGKTTFLNAALKVIDERERIITIEDTREVKLKQRNALHLLASRGAQGQAKVTPQDLLEACLRLRPNRIIMGELRGVEAFTYLEAINSGHPGSLTTVHADSPEFALERLALMVMRAGTPMTKPEITAYLKLTVPIIVQFSKDVTGNRFISQIYYEKAPVPSLQRASMASPRNLVCAANG